MDSGRFPSYALGEISRGELVAAHHLGGDVWARCGRGRCDERRGLARDRERDPAGGTARREDGAARPASRGIAHAHGQSRVAGRSARRGAGTRHAARRPRRGLVSRRSSKQSSRRRRSGRSREAARSAWSAGRRGPFRNRSGGREPSRPEPAAWHRSGAHGEGVKVAVVDLGFDGYARSQANGDLPSGAVKVNFCGSGGFEATSHGTAVAEIVAEVAPAADLYLVCVRDTAGLGLAVSYAREKGIQIVNHSASWFNTGRGDGTGAAGTPEGIVAAARAAGILWVNSAGNRAQQHWSGSFVDTNANGWSEYAPGDEGNTVVVPAGSFVCAALKWDDWPASAEDYDLYLTRSPGGAIVSRSNGPQTGLEPPTEQACAINRTTVAKRYAIGIKAHRVTGKPVRFDLFVYPGPNLEHRVAEGSVTEPGTSPAALSRRRGLLARQPARGLQLAGTDDRCANEARPHRAGLGLLVQLRPVLALRRQWVRGHLGGGAARRGRRRTRQAGEPELRA